MIIITLSQEVKQLQLYDALLQILYMFILTKVNATSFMEPFPKIVMKEDCWHFPVQASHNSILSNHWKYDASTKFEACI